MTPFHVNDKDDLYERYMWHLMPANAYLKENSLKGSKPYKFDIKISDDYNKVIESLKNGDGIKMAFVSLALYDLHLLKNDDFFEKVEHIGYERIGGDSGYYSCIVGYRLQGDKNYKDLIHDNSKTLLFGPKESTSTHILPKYLYLNDIDIEKDDAILDKIQDYLKTLLFGPKESTSTHILSKYLYFNDTGTIVKDHTIFNKTYDREEMIRMIKDTIGGGKYYCFLSNEDYSRLLANDKNLLGKVEIPIKIPYDVVLVNKKWWNTLTGPRMKDRKIILESLKKTEDKNQMFSVDADTRKIPYWKDRKIQAFLNKISYVNLGYDSGQRLEKLKEIQKKYKDKKDSFEILYSDF